MKVNVINRKLLKPLTPTPPNLRKYKISFTDELIPPMYMSVILFYQNPTPIITTHLQQSLSKILPQFYPFAGRYIRDDQLVDCCDEGAEFVEAEAVGVELIALIAKPKNDQLDYLLSRQTPGSSVVRPDHTVQVRRACSQHQFVAQNFRWIFARNIHCRLVQYYQRHLGGIISPSFDSPLLFPGINMKYDSEPPHSVVVKRLLFNKEAISSLRSKLRPKNEQGFLSRVHLVSAVIAKTLIGVELAKNGKSRPYFIGQGINILGRTNPPLPKHSCGNLVVESVTQCMVANEAKEMGLQELLYLIGDAIDETIAHCGNILSLDEDGRKKILKDPLVKMFGIIGSGECNAMWFTDWSKFGFYEADFGWGKPVWVRVGTVYAENLTVLVDNKEAGGIEAWVHLDENDVPYFERDDDMKLFIIA